MGCKNCDGPVPTKGGVLLNADGDFACSQRCADGFRAAADLETGVPGRSVVTLVQICADSISLPRLGIRATS